MGEAVTKCQLGLHFRESSWAGPFKKVQHLKTWSLKTPSGHVLSSCQGCPWPSLKTGREGRWDRGRSQKTLGAESGRSHPPNPDGTGCAGPCK